MPINPSIPSNWLELCREFEPTGLDAPWFAEAQLLLGTLGRSALALDVVQKLFLRATQLVPNACARNPEWISSVPSSKWALSTAWSDNLRGGQKRTSLFEAAHYIRGIDDEIDALTQFGQLGFYPVVGPREPDQPDWHLEGPPGDLWIEIKSKAAPESALQLLHSALCAAQLLNKDSRVLSWSVENPTNEQNVCRLRPSELDTLVEQAFAMTPQLVPILGREAVPHLTIGWPNSPSVDVMWFPPQLFVEMGPESSGKRLTFGATADRAAWLFPMPFARAAWAPPRLAPECLDRASKILDRTLLKTGSARGRQMVRSPENTLFVIKWHVPFNWDDALEAHPEDLDTILESLIESASVYRRSPALALWLVCFSGSKILLSPAAKFVLGTDSIVVSRPPRG